MISNEYLNKLPKWWEDKKYYDLVLSNDIDSLFTCNLLTEVKGWNINYFYKFDSMGLTEETCSDEFIGVDISFNHNMKCFDNHVVMLNEYDYCNSQSINLNVAERINRCNYFNKYCGSTLLMVWSLYDIPLPKSEEGKMILLAIDSTYKGFYSPYQNDNKSNYKYLVEVMGFEELYEVLKRHKHIDFTEVMDKYGLRESIDVCKGFLQTNINLKELEKVFDLPFFMPKNEFQLLYNFDNKAVGLEKYNYNIMKEDVSEDIFSIALTKRDFVNYSIRK